MADKATAGARNNSISVTVDYRGTVKDLGIWDTWEGGGITAENTKHRRGGMGKQVAIGGATTIDDVTISRDYDLTRDHLGVWGDAPDLAHWLSEAVGRAKVTASKQYLDEEGVGFGSPIVITGILIGYNQPASDSDSSDIAMVEIVINPNGTVG